MDKEIKKPQKEESFDGGFGAPDWKYVDEMLEWYKHSGNEINLKDFGYSEIQSNPILYELYMGRFNQ
jgi:hypothetical protein